MNRTYDTEFKMISLAITGTRGRMGQRLIALAAEHDCRVVAELPTGATWQTPADVMIDFSSPVGTRQWLPECVARGTPLLIGTTGLSADDFKLIDEAAQSIPVLQAGNTSLGVTVLCRLVADAARMLGMNYDAEIVETHHRHKKDAPSGTALMIADALLAATDRTREKLVYGRHGESPRQPGDVGMHSLRIGDEIGSHTAYFGAPGERIELTHKATTRDTFAHGAMRAAKWLVGKPAGRYQIVDVLGL